MWNKDLQKSVMNFGSLIRFYWNYYIAVTCIFKLGGVYMSISRRVKWNATTSVLNIMASNYRSEFHFCLRNRSEDFFTPPLHYSNPPIINFWKSVSNPPIIPKPPIIRYSRVHQYNILTVGWEFIENFGHFFFTI